jgi:exodeoxyribonuclease VII small subunit
LTTPVEELNFEEALAALEMIVTELEGGERPLEDALALFERGQKLAAYCNARLEDASLRVEQLTAEGEIIDASPQ